LRSASRLHIRLRHAAVVTGVLRCPSSCKAMSRTIAPSSDTSNSGRLNSLSPTSILRGGAQDRSAEHDTDDSRDDIQDDFLSFTGPVDLLTIQPSSPPTRTEIR
jgi:hypothetical protein